jgi:hypothetical protein
MRPPTLSVPVDLVHDDDYDRSVAAGWGKGPVRRKRPRSHLIRLYPVLLRRAATPAIPLDHKRYGRLTARASNGSSSSAATPAAPCDDPLPFTAVSRIVAYRREEGEKEGFPSRSVVPCRRVVRVRLPRTHAAAWRFPERFPGGREGARREGGGRENRHSLRLSVRSVLSGSPLCARAPSSSGDVE